MPKQLTLFGVKPIEPPPPTKLTSARSKADQPKPNRYAAFGLDAVKRSTDTVADRRTLFCLWDQKEVERGYSMCFANFVLSLPAAIRLQTATTRGADEDEDDSCFKCRRKIEQMHFSGGAGMSMGICPDCVQDAVAYLQKPVYIAPGTQFLLL